MNSSKWSFKKSQKNYISCIISRGKFVVLHNDGNLSVFKSDYFMCIWSDYLTLYYDDTYIIELYFPDIFSR